jgi:LytR cell envelope-related transcriptional attenuator
MRVPFQSVLVGGSARPGLAGQLERALTTRGFSRGRASTGPYLVHAAVVEYGAGADADAASLAGALGLSTRRRTWLHPGAISIIIGTDFTIPAGFAAAGSSPSASASATAVQAAGPGVAAPPPTALSALSGDGIRCVK